jgi:hypothetical protein
METASEQDLGVRDRYTAVLMGVGLIRFWMNCGAQSKHGPAQASVTC